MSAYEFTGRVVQAATEIEHFGEKGFYKNAMVVSDESDKYPVEVCFDCLKGAADQAATMREGDMVTVSFDVKSRYWEKGNRWFTSAAAFRVEKVGSKPAPRKQADPAQEGIELDSEDDGMPPF